MIEVFTITWNEEYLLPYFFQHYDWADKIIVYDNESTDNTINIIQSNPKAELRTYKTNNQMDNVALQYIKNNCWKGSKADWVIVCDADEFLVGHEILPQYAKQKVVFKPQGYNIVGKAGENPPINRGYKDHNFSKMVCFSPRIKEINYQVGSHHAAPVGGVVVDQMKLLHYMWLSAEFIIDRWARKSVRRCQNDINHRFGWHYEATEEQIRQMYNHVLMAAKPILPIL